MNTAINQTLCIQGGPTTKTEIRLRVGAAVTLLALGVFSLYLLEAGSSLGVPSDFSREAWYLTIAFFSLPLAPFLPSCSEYTFLDSAERKVISVKNYAWYKTFRNCRPLTDFSHIVVRHLCHPDGEGGETFTGSVGLKPLDRGPILWVKDFDTTQDAVPPAAEEFARRLKELTGLPLAGLWVGDPRFADRLHSGANSRSQDGPTGSTEPAATAQPTIEN